MRVDETRDEQDVYQDQDMFTTTRLQGDDEWEEFWWTLVTTSNSHVLTIETYYYGKATEQQFQQHWAKYGTIHAARKVHAGQARWVVQLWLVKSTIGWTHDQVGQRSFRQMIRKQFDLLSSRMKSSLLQK